MRKEENRGRPAPKTGVVPALTAERKLVNLTQLCRNAGVNYNALVYALDRGGSSGLTPSETAKLSHEVRRMAMSLLKTLG